jgi:histidine kinase
MRKIYNIHHSLTSQLIFLVGLILLISVSIWAFFNIRYHKDNALRNIVDEVDRLSNTIKLGAHYAMMLNSRDDINQIIYNIGRQEEIKNIRIYNKNGQIKFSNKPEDVDRITNIKDDACYICHRKDPPEDTISLAERIRIFDSDSGYRLLGIISPIFNETSCSTDVCHYHPDDKKILGALDVVVSLEKTDQQILSYENGIIALAVFSFLGISSIIGIFLMRFVNRPIKTLIAGTRLISQGKYDSEIPVDRTDEIGQLALAISQMGKKIGEKQEELNKQRNEYQNLFERVPCHVSVQDKHLRLIRYNREIARNFAPKPGDYCFAAYKGRSEPCQICPVLKTFDDGKSHESEESLVNRDGSESIWLVRTAPIRDSNREIAAVMEISLDITQLKRLEREIRKSEEKYYTIFNNIPNAVFVVDSSTMEILDCNQSVTATYGFEKEELLNTSLLSFFEESEREESAEELRNSGTLNQVRHITKDGRTIYVNIRVTRSEYLEREALLITASDITKRLLAEQQLIQASKMTTLGEMSAGVAHELNQPLSVIKTASNYLMRKVRKGERIEDNILKTMAEEIDSHVDRASRIISHLREFGRKSEVSKGRVYVNEPLNRAVEMFSQQLKLREIEVIKELGANLPPIWADSNRLEQVFINLLINARDAIEENCEQHERKGAEKKIFLRTSYRGGMVQVEVEDTGGGIPKPLLDRIFEPFFTTKKVGHGTGLGLSISYSIVQDYEGNIKVETHENAGSKFTVQFPVAAED